MQVTCAVGRAYCRGECAKVVTYGDLHTICTSGGKGCDLSRGGVQQS